MFDGIPNDEELDGEWQWPKSSLGQKIASLESSLRCLICSNYLNNPHSLLCGHSYCSECIRKHLDKSYNPTPSSSYCPTCREPAIPAQLRVSKDLIDVVSCYQLLRNDLLKNLKNNHPSNEDESESFVVNELEENPSQSQTKKKLQDGGRSEIKRLPSKLFHIETKDKVKKALEKLTENCSTKIRLDGDKDALVRRYTELVHLNNAQLSAKNPLTLSEIVQEVHKRERALEFHTTMSKKSNSVVDKIKSGQETKEVKAGFSELIKRARESKVKRQNPEVNSTPTSNSNSNAHNHHPQQIQEGSVLHNLSQNSQNSVTSTKSDLIEQGDWIIIHSRKLGRPFFFNISNQSGQFRIPPELSDLSQTWDHSFPGLGEKEIPNLPSVRELRSHQQQKQQKGSKRSVPVQLQHISDSSDDSSDEIYTPSTTTTKGTKRTRHGKIVTRSQERHLHHLQSQAQAQAQVQSQTQSPLAQEEIKQDKFIEIHEVQDEEQDEEDNEGEGEGEVNHITCLQCTYHNPIGSLRCEICSSKLHISSSQSLETTRKNYLSSSYTTRPTNTPSSSKKPSNKNIKSVLGGHKR